MGKLDFVVPLIQREFDQLKAQNPSYSLRGFSRRLGCSVATLSEVLRGKRPVSAKLARAFVDKVKLDAAVVGRVEEALVRSVAQDRAEDIRAIEESVRCLQDAWNRHATHEMALAWALDGCLIEPWGLVIDGRAAIEKFYQAAHTTYLKDAQITMTPVRVRFAGKYSAFLDLHAVIRGVRREGDPQLFDMHLEIPSTLIHRKGRWLFLATRPYSLLPAGTKPWGSRPPA